MKIVRITPPMALMFLGLVLFFYHYYDSSLKFNYFVTNLHLRDDNQFIFILTLAPFTLSSIGCPLGGVLFAFWQNKSRNYIFPYLFLLDSALSIFSNIIAQYLYVPQVLGLALVCRLLQGMLIGGLFILAGFQSMINFLN